MPAVDAECTGRRGRCGTRTPADRTFASRWALARAARTPGLHCLNLLRGTMLGYTDNNDKTTTRTSGSLAPPVSGRARTCGSCVVPRPELPSRAMAVRRKYLGVAEEATDVEPARP